MGTERQEMVRKKNRIHNPYHTNYDNRKSPHSGKPGYAVASPDLRVGLRLHCVTCGS